MTVEKIKTIYKIKK